MFQSGKPINESDLKNNPHYVVIHEDTLSQLVVPILSQDNVVGAISVESSEASAFDKEDLVLLEGISVQAGSALSREKHSREYKKVLTVALAGAAAQLWRHGLKERAKLIIGRVDDARRQPAVDTQSILQSIREDALYIENFRFIPLSSTEGVAPEMLNEVLHGFLGDFRNDLEAKGLTLTLRLELEQTKNRRVNINQRWFQKALSIFLENAREAITSAKDQVIEVQTEISEDERFCRILIKNTGQKISDEIWDKMGHEQIIKGDGNAEKGGGLLLAGLILSVYEGRIEKLNNQDQDIVLGITLPLFS